MCINKHSEIPINSEVNIGIISSITRKLTVTTIMTII